MSVEALWNPEDMKTRGSLAIFLAGEWSCNLADIKINLKSLLVPTQELVTDSSINITKELVNFGQVLKNMQNLSDLFDNLIIVVEKYSRSF